MKPSDDVRYASRVSAVDLQAILGGTQFAHSFEPAATGDVPGIGPGRMVHANIAMNRLFHFDVDRST
ncbi:hypothetical protein CC2G_011550 [Coprinopsis cinerea AmutBmut pab1-1]|nr:hypothetical protein CC2G_011550 [Coprinopsis cinerea AmutBmut pab1-1]